LPKTLREQITYFFLHYKDLEPNKWDKLNLWDDWKMLPRWSNRPSRSKAPDL